MKNECNIIRDILPLYIEGLASADTVAFVEEHLEKCSECRKELENMKSEISLDSLRVFTNGKEKEIIICSQNAYYAKWCWQ